VPPALAARVAGAPAALTDALTLRVADLAEYQDVAYAGRYLETVLEVARAEEAATGDPAFPVSAAVVDGLAHLLAVKDEYEVARLHLDPAVRTAVEDEFGPGTRTSVLLSPPTLRALGLRGKVRVGRAAGPMFRLLRAGRRLRGTALDPFGHTALRRTERALPDEYLALVRRGLAGLTPQTAPTVVAIAALAGEVRGYEDVRRRSIDRFRRRAAELEGRLAARGGAGPTTPAHHWPVAG
jgi:indolepyruvate ferredoxin oxidoreductase